MVKKGGKKKASKTGQRGKNWLPESKLIAAMKKHQGWIMAISQEVDRSPAALYKRIGKHAKLKTLWQSLLFDRDTFITEMAEQKFMAALRADERWAIVKALNDKSSKRGYGVSQATDLAITADGNTDKLDVVVLPANGREAQSVVATKKIS